MPTDRARFARDFFFELMKDSQRLRAGYLAERERWLRSLAVDGREELLFEFEMLLRGVERFFNLHNLPLDQSTVVGRNFMDELRSVRDAINRAIKLARFLLDPPSDRRLMFRKYVESQILDERVRRELAEAELEQGTPQESLFLIRSDFIALRGIIERLQKLEHADYELFANIGQLALREISLNKYFKPFRPLEFRQEYDRIKDVRILELLLGLNGKIRKPVSIAFLALFRLLHYLRYVPGPQELPTRRSQVILALVRSETFTLAAFIEGELSARLALLGSEQSARAVSAAEDLRCEANRVVKEELSFVGPPPKGAIGRARDGLVGICRQSIAQLAQIFDPGFDEALFDSPAARVEQSRRLRLDLFAYREVCHWAGQVFAKGSAEQCERALAQLKVFVAYFRDVSYQLLRYGDYDPFDRFAAIINETRSAPTGEARRNRLVEDCRVFTEMLERTFAAVSRRGDLAKLPFDAQEGRALACRYTQKAA
ncbi:MAG: hypothetical protein ACOX6T_11570 [Myxococcales bacterium]|jgi:hypothetical protein